MFNRSSVWQVALLTVMASPVVAQQVDEDDREETAVEAFDLDEEEERESLLDEARSGPSATAAQEVVSDIEAVERTGAAGDRLQRLVDDTPMDDPSRAEYMFRLAELKYGQSRFYEQRAFERRDESFILRETNPQRARVLDEMAADDLSRSDALADEAILLYADIYEFYRDGYDGIDAVLYYLGANLLTLERNDAARTIFEELALNYPRSEYLPQALLMLGELDFAEGYFDDALTYYDAVAQFPESSVYPYTLYKQAWCLYNLAQGPGDYEAAIQSLYDAVIVAEQSEGRERLRRDSLRDMTLFYSEIYPADVALAFFEELAPDMAFDLLSRLARIYGERGEYDESNTLYRELIALNSDSFDIVEYQREIVRNTRPGADEVALVREVRRLAELFEASQSLADADADSIRRRASDLELLLRQLATTYHAEAQTTQNEELYALAYNLYGDYIENFSDSEHAYTMFFYYGELLYRDEEYVQAAEAYESALQVSNGEGQYDQEATYAACHAYMKMVELDADTDTTGTGVSADTEDDRPTPEPREIEPEYLRMLAACERYLETNPSLEDSVQIEFVNAYTFYRFDHLDEAVTRFGAIARNHHSVDSGRAQVSAELLLDSLNLQRDYASMKTWIDEFRSIQALNRGEFAVRLSTLSEQVDFIECRGMQNDEQWLDAGQCYISFVENHFEADLVDRALYNAAVAFRDASEIDFSLSALDYLVQFRPDSPLAVDAIYELGRNYHRLAMYDVAAGYYEDYVEREGDPEKQCDALVNASQFRHGLGQHDQAVATLRAFIRNCGDTDESESAVGEAYFQIARAYDDEEDHRDAIQAYEQFIDEFGGAMPGRALEAHGRVAALWVVRGNVGRSYDWHERALAFWDDLDPEARAEITGPGRAAAAEARFMIGERIFEEFETIPLEGSEEEVQAALQEKRDAGTRAAEVYGSVFEYADNGWAIAAFTRLGRLYHVFYEQVIDAPIPDGMTPIQVEVYQSELERQAAELKNEAMMRYARAIEISREVGYFSEYAEEAAAHYQELDPTFKAGSEVRVQPGYDSIGWYAAPFIVPESVVLDAPADAPSPRPAPAPAPAPAESGPMGGETASATTQEL